MFIFERETEEWQDWETESEAGSRLQVVSTEPDVGLEPMNCKIITWAEVGCLTHWAYPLFLFVVWLLSLRLPVLY